MTLRKQAVHIGPHPTYKYIYLRQLGLDIVYFASIYNKKIKWQNQFSTEKEAAIAVDKKLIQVGMDPVNILKKKQC